MKKLMLMIGILSMVYVRAENVGDNGRKVGAKEPSAADQRGSRFIGAGENNNESVLDNETGFEWTLYIPNTFTPNSDGLNDLFTLYGTGISSVILQVYNRNGEKLFETAEVCRGWDGNYKGQPCEVATYVYCSEVILNSGERFNKIGHVNLIR